jgi:rhamnosyltransferase
MARLDAVIAAVVRQVGDVVVIDNASSDAADLAELAAGYDVEIVRQASNLGLSAAQNVGIAWARQRGAEYALLLDQDSVPASDMVERLLDGLQRARSANLRVAALGPRFRDSRDGQDFPFIEVHFPSSKKLWCDAGGSDIVTDFLISSGSLIPLAVLDDVGGMEEGLFIDNIDMEWCFRARSRGYVLIGVCSALMAHELGEDRAALFGGYQQVVHSPTRLYFIMRNRVLLYRRPYTPRTWIAQDLLRLPLKFAIFSVLVAPRLRNARFMLRGLWDAARNRSGPCPMVKR